MNFGSDNKSGVTRPVFEAIDKVNTGKAKSYGNDEYTEEAQSLIRDIFNHKTARVFFVTTGTAANVLALQSCGSPMALIFAIPPLI